MNLTRVHESVRHESRPGAFEPAPLTLEGDAVLQALGQRPSREDEAPAGVSLLVAQQQRRRLFSVVFRQRPLRLAHT